MRIYFYPFFWEKAVWFKSNLLCAVLFPSLLARTTMPFTRAEHVDVGRALKKYRGSQLLD